MRPKQEEEVKPGAPAYMNTYGDMMTLLLTFFILLFAMSTVDIEKYKAFANSFEGSAGILEGETVIDNQILLGNGIKQHPTKTESTINPKSDKLAAEYNNKRLKEISEDVKSYLKKVQLDEKVEVINNGDYISIKFDDILLFDTGKANLKPGAIPILDKIGTKLQEYLKNANIRLAFEGHTDNIPINTVQFPSNWELSASRAIAVAKFYIDEMNFNPSQVSAEGFGQHVPIESNQTPEGRSANRRVEIKIVTEPEG